MSKEFLFSAALALFAFTAGYIAKDKIFPSACPSLTCPECPPQTVLYINNEKIKTKGGGNIDLKSILKDNTILGDTTTQKVTKETKRKGFLGKFFSKK